MVDIEPMTDAQDKALGAYDNGDHLILSGSAGTGKTFLAIAMGIEDVLDPDSDYKRLMIVRSVVPTRDMGFLPGTEQEKTEVYTRPYEGILHELFKVPDAWKKLTEDGTIQFESTSFVRGVSWHDTIVIVDEMQNLTGHELDSVITRLGKNSKIVLCGDYTQTDLERSKDKAGIAQFLKIANEMEDFTIVEFGWKDIVRSGIVRDYIMTKERLKNSGMLPPDF